MTTQVQRVSVGAGNVVSTRISLRATKRLKNHEAEMRFHMSDCKGCSRLLCLIQYTLYICVY